MTVVRQSLDAFLSTYLTHSLSQYISKYDQKHHIFVKIIFLMNMTVIYMLPSLLLSTIWQTGGNTIYFVQKWALFYPHSKAM